MVSLTASRGTAEIVAPAGNREKMEMAVAFGAGAVYFGGPLYNLRIQADNFSPEELDSAITWCNGKNVRSILLLNSFLHEDDITIARNYLSEIAALRPDAVMISDPGMLELAREAGITADFHLSTQMSTLNHLSARFWHRAGFKRIVLGREASLEDVRNIAGQTDAEIEIFAHGALCIAYSGRCLLSRYLAGRDGNQGDCAQSCRWHFSLVESKRPGNYLDIIEHASGTEILSSKDLKLINLLDQYQAAGVSAFKLEGRMKSVYHAAQTARIYSHGARCAGTEDFASHLPFWNEELDLVNHRPYTEDLFNEFGGLGFTGIPMVKRAQFLGHKNGSGPLQAANPFRVGDTVEAIYPIGEKIIDHQCRIQHIADECGVSHEMARPGQSYEVTCEPPLGDFAVIRKRLENRQ